MAQDPQLQEAIALIREAEQFLSWNTGGAEHNACAQRLRDFLAKYSPQKKEEVSRG